MPKIEMTTMVMVQDPTTGKVLVQDRALSWKGLSFPGGHVEDGESIVGCAVREVKEETGLTVTHLKSCGVIHWLYGKNNDRYLVYLFKTTTFSGSLIENCEEGSHSWITLDELKDTPSENGMPKYLPMFLEDTYAEAFGYWTDDEPWELLFQ